MDNWNLSLSRKEAAWHLRAYLLPASNSNLLTSVLYLIFYAVPKITATKRRWHSAGAPFFLLPPSCRRHHLPFTNRLQSHPKKNVTKIGIFPIQYSVDTIFGHASMRTDIIPYWLSVCGGLLCPSFAYYACCYWTPLGLLSTYACATRTLVVIQV